MVSTSRAARRIVGLVLLATFLVARAPARAQDRPQNPFPQEKWEVELRSTHYLMRSKVPQAESQELLDLMEQLHDTYTNVFGVQNLDGKFTVFQIYLFKSRQDYIAAGAPANSEAFYDTGMKSLVGYSDLSKNRLMGKFAHEGTHQFCHMYFRDMGKLPKWFGEGIAECFGSFERKGSKIQLCRLKPFFARSNLYDLQQAIRRGNLPSLETLVVRANDNEFDALGRLGYSIAWSFCHFLLAFPVQEATSMVVPDGKYAWNLKQYIEKLREKGATAAQAVEAGFSKAKDGTPWDWKKIEAEWKKYFLGMKVRLADFAFEELLPEYESLAWKQSTAGKYAAARSNAPEAATQKALDTVDGVFESLMHLFKIPPDKVKAKDPIRRPVLMLFDDRAAFQAAGFSPNEVSGFRGKYLYTFQRELFEIEMIMSVTDQFLQLYVPNPEQLPPWVRSGLSLCMAAGELKDKRWAPCLQKTPMGAHLRRQLTQCLTQGKALSVADVKQLPEDRLMNPQDPASVLAWGLVECLLVYPQFVSDKAYYEKNTYTDSFQKFLMTLSEGKRSPADAWDAAFTKTARDSLDSDFSVFLRKASQQ